MPERAEAAPNILIRLSCGCVKPAYEPPDHPWTATDVWCDVHGGEPMKLVEVIRG